nr:MULTISPECIES: hypothetical protein [unclassified Haladaptatus]
MLPLAVVPLLATFIDIDKIRKVSEVNGLRLGVSFHFPTGLPTFWTFVSLPNTTTGIHISPMWYFVPIYAVVTSILMGGFLGSIRDGIETGSYDFTYNARNYFLPLLGYTVLVWVAILATGGAALVFAPLIFVALLVLLVLNFVFYGVPFIVVVDDRSLTEALRRSYELATGESKYATFGVGYLVVVFLLSLVGTLFINLGIAGIVIGAVLSAPVSLALTVATVEFFIDLRSPGSNPVERPPTERSDWPPTERSDYD